MFNRLYCFSLLVLLAGCGSAEAQRDELEVSPTWGTVTVKGKPVAGITVIFFPEGQTKGQGGRGTTDDTGQFMIKYQDGRDGVPQGNYKVLFEHFVMPDGSKVPESEFPADVGAINQLPHQFSNFGTSPFKAEVPQGGTSDLEFDLK
ncbi:carboxypeptidase-like regulatory domain-containing protein [Gimesia sp.]|uniref:carboxypeptidase-like regulatory domain-containing protein n=1 Tax=Gimesia sp. TaxID=2024833 RepID=UPI003A920495